MPWPGRLSFWRHVHGAPGCLRPRQDFGFCRRGPQRRHHFRRRIYRALIVVRCDALPLQGPQRPHYKQRKHERHFERFPWAPPRARTTSRVSTRGTSRGLLGARTTSGVSRRDVLRAPCVLIFHNDTLRYACDTVVIRLCFYSDTV